MPGTPSAPERAEYDTRDPGIAREFIDHAYGGQLRLASTAGPAGPAAEAFRARLSQVDAGVIGVSDLQLAPTLTFDVAGQDQYYFTTLISGTGEFDYGRTSDRFSPGDVFLSIDRHTSSVCRLHDYRASTITLPGWLLAWTARSDPEKPGDPVKFLSRRPVSDGARQWRNAARYVSNLLSTPDALARPLVIVSAARLVATTALAIFPNTTVAEPASQDGHDAHADTARRAAAFIEANADHNIALSDIAGAAHTTNRAVQLAFRRHLDTTPMEYLRRVRLDHAHRELMAGDPASTSVTVIAYRWGFLSSSRFAAYYRQAYGVPPSRTLHGN